MGLLPYKTCSTQVYVTISHARLHHGLPALRNSTNTTVTFDHASVTKKTHVQVSREQDKWKCGTLAYLHGW